MSDTPETDLTSYMEPTPVTFDMGEGPLPLNATFHSPSIISDWRSDQYRAAVVNHLTEDMAYQELQDLEMGCGWAANRSSRYDPYQTATVRDYWGQGGVLSPEEQQVLKLLGGEEFMRIHKLPPPAALIDFMLSGGTDKFTRPDLSQITVAVIKGHIPWEDRFQTAGVPLPDDYVNEVTAKEDAYRAQFDDQKLGVSSQPTFLHGLRQVFSRLKKSQS